MTEPDARRFRVAESPATRITGSRLRDMMATVEPITPVDPAPPQDLPVAGGPADTLFADRNDAASSWAIGASTLSSAAADFTFAAVQDGGIDKQGSLANRATLTFTVLEGDSADVAASRAQPGHTIKPVLSISTDVTFHLTYVNDDGTPAQLDLPTTTQTRADGALVVNVALFGPQVVQAAHALMDPTAPPTSMSVQRTYSAWQETQLYEQVPATYTGTARMIPARDLSMAQLNLAVRTRAVAAVPVDPPPVPDPPMLRTTRAVTDLSVLRKSAWLEDIMRISVAPSTTRWLVTTATSLQEVPIGAAFAGDAARGCYTLTAGGDQRPLTGPGDLTSFGHPASEYRELTSLGDIPSQYPSLRALYVGQQSGRVVAVPQRYAIACTHSGLSARCDAILDAGTESLSGCEFTFSFTLLPDVSPVDYALVAQALPSCPEAKLLPLQLTLPSGLDPRRTAPESAISVTDGTEPFALSATITVRDHDDLPAVTTANLLLAQLAADGPSALTTSVAVRLDDAYPTPVETALALSVRSTAQGDDLAYGPAADDPARLQITNASPYPQTLGRALGSGAGPVDLGGQTLAGGADLVVDVAPIVTSTLPAVDRTISVPAPLPGAEIGNYVTLNITQVQDVQHALIVNGAGLHFAADGLLNLRVEFTLDDQPQLTVPGFTLQDGHVSDSAHVLIPVVAVVSGLSTTVSLIATTGAGVQPVITIAHDFVAEPILIVTPDTLD